MSFCVVAEKEIIKYKNSNRKTPFYSNLTETENCITIFSGEYHKTEEQLERVNWMSCKHQELFNVHDSYSIVLIDKINGEIHFILSQYGIERLYYFQVEDRFVISDDYWEIINYLGVEYDNLDIDAIIECMNSCYPLEDTTFTKDTRVVLPGYRGKFSLKSKALFLEKTFEFKYQPNKELTIESATEKMDSIINVAIEKIKNECGDVRYAFGLSGGLDSRIIPYYMKKNGLQVKSFIIGEKAPNHICLSGDHYKARQIANIFHLQHIECKWNREVLQKTIELDVKNNPLCPPQFFKGQFDFDFDVLVTGGNGYIVGSTMPDNIDSISVKELAQHMRMLGRDFKPNLIRNTHIETAVKVIFKRSIKLQHSEKWYKEILSEENDNKILTKYCNYINKEKEKGKTNIDIYEQFFHDILGARNKFGGFESLIGTKRSFSIYLPHIFDETLTWPLEFLKERAVLKNLIRVKIPEVANVKEQKYEGNTITKKSTLWSNLFNIIEFIIRGNGTEMVNSNFRKCSDMFIKDMSYDTKWFYNIFSIKEYIGKILKHDNKYALIKIWKIKLVIDLLETGAYKDYIDKQDFMICYSENHLE